LKENLQKSRKQSLTTSPLCLHEEQERSRVRLGPLVDDDGDVITSAQEMSEKFNSFFASVFTKDNEDNIPTAEQCYMGSEDVALQDLEITEDMISV